MSTTVQKTFNQKGFTLLEILVVLTIMGFLIAMVAPRLAGISGDAIDVVCDTNQNRMVTYMSSYFEKTNRFPNKLTNLVDEIADDVYQLPAVSDQDPDNGPETFAKELWDRNQFVRHYLSGDEIKEIKNMGIVKVFNLNDYSAYDGLGLKETDFNTDDNAHLLQNITAVSPAMEEVEVKAGLAVAMVGIGATTNGDDEFTMASTASETGWGEPEFFGRIVLGMGSESALITSGIIANAAHCPGGLQNTDNATYNDYNLVLPRLAATSERMTGTTEDSSGVSTPNIATSLIANPSELKAYAYDDGDEPAGDATAADDFAERVFDITEAQETWQYATQCPEGHMYPEDDGEFWYVNFDNGSTDE